MTGSLYDQMVASFPADASRVALDAPGQGRWSFAELEAEVARYAAAIQGQGVTCGDRVVLCVEKSPQALFVYLSCLKAGFVFVPLNTAYRTAELTYLVDNADPALIICDPGRLDEFDRLSDKPIALLTLDKNGQGSLAGQAAKETGASPDVHCAPDDLAALLYTSGTTGQPKGAMLTHGNLASNGGALKTAWAFTGGDVLLHALPIFHAHGLFVACHCALLSGAKMIWLAKFDPETVYAHLPRATVFMGVPTFYTRLLSTGGLTREMTKGMRLFTSGSAPLLVETFEGFKEATGHTILERYGMTETGMNTSNPYEGERRAGSVGFPLPDVELSILDEDGAPQKQGETGDLQVRGPNVFSAYWRLPEKSAEEFAPDGWFKTGDLAMQDEEGYVHLVGRAKDLIICGGYNVYPKQIEALIDDRPGIEEAAIIGVPHVDFGEAVVAVVTLKDNAPLNEAEMIAELKDEVANYKVPKRIVAVDQLPRNTMGKVQKNLLRATYRDLLKPEV